MMDDKEFLFCEYDGSLEEHENLFSDLDILIIDANFPTLYKRYLPMFYPVHDKETGKELIRAKWFRYETHYRDDEGIYSILTNGEIRDLLELSTLRYPTDGPRMDELQNRTIIKDPTYDEDNDWLTYHKKIRAYYNRPSIWHRPLTDEEIKENHRQTDEWRKNMAKRNELFMKNVCED